MPDHSRRENWSESVENRNHRGFSMVSLVRIAAPLAFAAVALTGCAGDGNHFQTGSLASQPAPEQTQVVTPKITPECAALASQIDGLRKDGTLEKLEKAATGKGATVPVKRDSLAKQAAYNKATADFQAKCGANSVIAQMRQQQAQAATQARVAAEARQPTGGTAPAGNGH